MNFIGAYMTALPPARATLPPSAVLRTPAIIAQETDDGVIRIEPDAAVTNPRLPSLDPTRKQSLEELEAQRAKSMERSSEPELFVRRPYPTTEVGEDDIEAAIELAPQARKSLIGIAKKKPGE